MKKAYLLIYSDLCGTRDEIKTWANASAYVDTWRFDLPNTFYIISSSTSGEMAEELRMYTNGNGRFLIAEVGDDRNGWLPKESWHLLRHKEHLKK